MEQLSPTTYSLNDPETGKLKQRPAHVTQIARVRLLGTHIVDERERATMLEWRRRRVELRSMSKHSHRSGPRLRRTLM